MNILGSLVNKDSRKYNIEKIQISKNNFYLDFDKNSFFPEKIFKNKNILILGPGKNLSKIEPFLQEIVNKKKMVILSINKIYFPKLKADQYVSISHPAKIMSNSKKLIFNKKNKIIIPMPNNKKNTFSYGIKISEKKIKFYKNYCQIPQPLALFYALGIANSGKCKSIYLAGIDGYAFGDERNFVIDDFFKKYEKNKFLQIKSLTPTRYKLLTISPFSDNY